MPTYVYECAKCGDEVEAWQSFTDDPLRKHAGCGGKLTKVLQPVGIVFKGSGFHRTDSRNGAKRSRSDGNGDSKDSTPSDTKSAPSGDATSRDNGGGTGSKRSESKTPASKKPAASTTS
jgi:putative FmdB family regulatory protein